MSVSLLESELVSPVESLLVVSSLVESEVVSPALPLVLVVVVPVVEVVEVPPGLVVVVVVPVPVPVLPCVLPSLLSSLLWVESTPLLVTSDLDSPDEGVVFWPGMLEPDPVDASLAPPPVVAPAPPLSPLFCSIT